MLLASLQSQANRVAAVRVLGHPHEATRDLALIHVLGGKKGGMRSTEAQGHAQALAVSHADARSPFSGRGQKRQRQEIGRYGHHERFLGVCFLGKGAIIIHRPVSGRVLQAQCERPAVSKSKLRLLPTTI